MDSSIPKILHHYRDKLLFLGQVLQNYKAINCMLIFQCINQHAIFENLGSKYLWLQLMVVGVIGASGVIVQRISMAYKWGPDNVWIQSLNLVENCALVPMQQLWGDAQTYPDAVKVFDKWLSGSVGWASGCHAGGREFDLERTLTQGLKITEEKVLPLQLHLHLVRLSSLLG